MELDCLAPTRQTWFFYPKTSDQGYGGLHDCCSATTGTWSNVEGFVCEFYAAPGTFAIGTGRSYDEAESFCQDYYGGHLASIHNQADYDKIALLTAHYSQPLRIGLHSDGQGNWEWADGSEMDIDFLRAHSFDGLAGTDETVGVFYPPVCNCPDGKHGWGCNDGVQSGSGPSATGVTCSDDQGLADHTNHALHDDGDGSNVEAFICASSGSQVRAHMAPWQGPPEDPTTTPPPGGGH